MADGAVPPYGIPAVAVDWLPADIPLRTGLSRAAAHGYTAFFTESFIDELAREAGVEPLSFRMQMLGGNTRLGSEEHTSELQSLMRISYAVFCLKKKITESRHSNTAKTK